MQPFEFLNSEIKEVLMNLEAQDQKERAAELDVLSRLRQIPRETGEFLFQFLLVHAHTISSEFIGLEIGTSGGYSTIWQGLALKKIRRGKLISLDNDPKKYDFAKENIKNALIDDYVDLILEDAKNYINNWPHKDLHYIFLDAEKEDYSIYYNLLKENGYLTSGVVLIADNTISHKEYLEDFLTNISGDSDVSSIVVPIGSGLTILRWI